MVRRALVPGAIATLGAFVAGYLIGGPGIAVSAALGVFLAVTNFAVHGWTLAWASDISIHLVHTVAMVGPIVRIGAIVGIMFLLNTTAWFSPVAFALTLVPVTIVVLILEARLVLARGVAMQMQIPADPVAARAADQLALRETT